MTFPDGWPLAVTVAAPLLALAVLLASSLRGGPAPERGIARLIRWTTTISWLASGWTLIDVARHGPRALGPMEWFDAPGAHASFELGLSADATSGTASVLAASLVGLVARFSLPYLHRERGFTRFFALLACFAVGAQLVALATSLDLLFLGWELMGLTSTLLVSFFWERPGPAAAGVRVYTTYRVADVSLLLGIALLHHHAHTTQLARLADVAPTLPWYVGLFLAVGALGKSAQLPFSGWLPSAMEGPTPSGALFYGALGVSAGAYLVLRIAPVIETSLVATCVIGGAGAVTALLATGVGRAQPDAKTALAYASMAQIGLVFVELAAGFTTLASAHLVGHALLRTHQFLTAPSRLQATEQMRSALGGRLLAKGAHLERALPNRVQRALYAWAIDRGGIDTVTGWLVERPVLAVASWLDGLDRAWVGALSGWPDRARHDLTEQTQPSEDPEGAEARRS